jgi:hypothetical protein
MSSRVDLNCRRLGYRGINERIGERFEGSISGTRSGWPSTEFEVGDENEVIPILILQLYPLP